MADIQTQRRNNPRTDRKEPYLTLRWHDPVTRKRKAKSLGFVSQREATEALQMLEAQLLVQSRAASGSRGESRRAAPVATPAPQRPLEPATGPAPCLRDWLEAHYLPMFKVDHSDAYIRQECLSASWLAELLGHHPINVIGLMHIDRYKHHRLTTPVVRTGKPAAPGTVNIELGTLSRALRYAQDLGVLTQALPRIKRVAKKKTKKRYLRPHEVEALIEAARPSPDHPDRNEAGWLAILLMANLGLRRGEAMTREWSDIVFDPECPAVHVTHKPAIQWFVKGGRRRMGRERVVPMTPVLRQALLEVWIARGQPKTGWIFPGGRHSKTNHPQKDCRSAFKAAALRAGIGEDAHPHLLRHAWASRLAMDGVDRKSLQEMGGWEDGRMLDEVYAHVTSPHLHGIMARQGIGGSDKV